MRTVIVVLGVLFAASAAAQLDTQGGDFSDDLAKSAAPLDDRGKEFKAPGWEGAAPQAVQLRIDRPGEAKPRFFRWELK